MCKQSSSRQETTYPQAIMDIWESIGPQLTGAATDLTSQPFQPYTGATVADFSGDQTNAFQLVRDLISNAPQIGPQVQGWIETAATAPGQEISTERLVDEGGRLGSISDYLTPAMAAAEGPVQQAIRKITEAAGLNRNRIGAAATSAGAYGDARHGVRDAMLDRDTSLAIGETAGNLYNQAFNQAMGQRAADLGRFLTADTANAGYDEAALNRLFTGATTATNTAGANQQQLLQQISTLLETGAMQQANEQSQLGSDYQQYLMEYGHPFNILAALTGAIRGTPADSTTTTTQPNNSGLGFLGSLFGGLMSPVAAGGTTALGSLMASI